MLKYLVMIIFVFLLLCPAFMSGHQYVDVLFLPGYRFEKLPLGGVMFIFAIYGVAAALVLALIDRTQLVAAKKQLTRQNNKLRQELESLRQMMAVERDDE